jgi:hypothetical protein
VAGVESRSSHAHVQFEHERTFAVQEAYFQLTGHTLQSGIRLKKGIKANFQVSCTNLPRKVKKIQTENPE